jgi:hypothetical protein
MSLSGFSTLRVLFFYPGVEIFEDDIEFCKDGLSLYVSRGKALISGEEFNQNSTFAEYEIIKKIG